MSIQSEIDRINNNVSDALAATAEMGASVPETANSNDLGRLIRSIPQSGGGGTSINVTAEVGQTIVVKAVDENGKPTAWESADYQPRTHWMERVELLPETVVVIDPDEGTGIIPVDFALEAGKPYTIKYNGVEYADCVGVELEEGVIYFGNFSAMDESFPVTEHPFVAMYGVADIDGDGNIDHIVGVMPLDGSESVTLSIFWETIHKLEDKYLPDNVPHIESHGDVILSDYIIPADDGGYTYITEPIGTAIIGANYEVRIGSQTFQCTAKKAEFSPESFYATICDDDRYVYIHLARKDIAPEGFYGLIGNGAIEGDTLSISAAYTAHKVDERCLPPSFFIVPVQMDGNYIDGYTYTSNYTYREVSSRIRRNGDVPVLRVLAGEHSFTMYYVQDVGPSIIIFCNMHEFRDENGYFSHEKLYWTLGGITDTQ